MKQGTTLRQRTCRQCGRPFLGGPRAWYCPMCRRERQRIQNAEHKRRKRRGETRELGTMDICVVCGTSYEIGGPNQRYCPSCAPLAVAAVDREQALDYYAANKDAYNQRRNHARRAARLGPRICRMCQQKYIKTEHGDKGCCSDACRRQRHRLLQAQADARRDGRPVPTVPPPVKKIIDWSDVDWSLQNTVIARLKGCSHQAVANRRKIVLQNNEKE